VGRTTSPLVKWPAREELLLVNVLHWTGVKAPLRLTKSGEVRPGKVMRVSVVVMLKGWVQGATCLHVKSGSESEASQCVECTEGGDCSGRDKTAIEILSKMLLGPNQQKAWALRPLLQICHLGPGLVTIHPDTLI
jgi:hypothetical protein